MIPPAATFLEACVFLARRHDWELSTRDVRLIESLIQRHADAIELVAAPEEEPAAIFFAFCRDHSFLGEDYLALPITMAGNHARALGLRLRASRFELVEQARAVSAGILSYADVRRWFAERLEPAPRS